MTYLYNDPRKFREEFFAGYLAAYDDRIVGVAGAYGAMRADGPPTGRVAVLIGGGSGHYPSRAGLVGPGLADIAVVGDTFASPSGEQILRCTRAVNGGHGVVYLYGNYAGDCLNFDLAATAAQADGIPVRQVVGTDDVASAPRGRECERRGIAGDFFLFKIAGAAAAEGRGLDAVVEAAGRANANARSFGVAFGGCTLPGQRQPLFTVEPGRMETGLGIHGEPGVGVADMGTADQIGELLVRRILDDAPAGAQGKVAVLVNSLGRTNREELFVVYRKVEQLLASAQLDVHHVIVDSLTSSLDMAGLSLSLLWLDDDLARLYDQPAETPAYTHRPRRPTAAPRTIGEEGAASAAPAEAPSTADLMYAGALAVFARFEENEEQLGKLDAAAGDGDHGRTVVRGMRAAVAATGQTGDPGSRLVAAGLAFSEAAGGASGALYGALIEAVGSAVGSGASVAAAIRAGLDRVRALGKAEQGDKTMVDALQPFCDTLDRHLAEGASLAEAWALAAAVATDKAAATANLVSRRGRSSKLGDRSLGWADPGATSSALALSALTPTFQEALSSIG